MPCGSGPKAHGSAASLEVKTYTSGAADTALATMGDPVNGRYKAFLFVGIAYFLTAVLAPLFLLMARGAAFSGYTASGAWWSLIAGIAGARP